MSQAGVAAVQIVDMGTKVSVKGVEMVTNIAGNVISFAERNCSSKLFC